MSSEKIAHDCGTIVLTDSLSFFHHPDRLEAWVKKETGSNRYDLLSLPFLESWHSKRNALLASDIATAISLHRNERILAYSTWSGPVEAILHAVRALLPPEMSSHLTQHVKEVGSSDHLMKIPVSDTLIICCMDWRLHGEAGGLLRKLSEAMEEDATEFDLLATAGGGKELVFGTQRWDVIMPRIKSTQARRVIVLSHTDCGAYGGNCAFDDPRHQLQVLQYELQDACWNFWQTELQLDVVMGVVHIDEENDCVDRVQFFT